ncbi:MAG: hypothetical protein HY305_06770 [Sphingobacteriales bacterium]|nr:hypothetical protein [Sphingobacteriales bacterium]
MIKNSSLLAFICLISFQACKQNVTQTATKWSEDIKTKIIEDASLQPDKTEYDSIKHELHLYKNNKKLKYYYFTPVTDSTEKIIRYDTAFVIFYSADQDFQLVRKPCITGAERSEETVAYKGNAFGLVKFTYCSRPITETGFRYNNLNVGIWTKYDSEGKVTSETDNGNKDILKKLEEMKYYR